VHIHVGRSHSHYRAHRVWDARRHCWTR
jgi:hypothetical protein